MGKKNKDSFLVDMWEKIFRILSYISIFHYVRKLKKSTSYRFVDFWILGNFTLAIVCSLLVFYLGEDYTYLAILISIYGSLRVFEIIVYQINVVFFDQYRKEKKGEVYRLKSVRRMILALLHNYVEIMFWFATITFTIARVNYISIKATWIEYIISTILCVSIFDRSGLENLLGENLFITQLVFVEIVSGLIMTIISIARFLNILPAVDQIGE